MKPIMFVLHVSLLMFACSEDDANPSTPGTSEVLMPLAVGNYWIYTSTVKGLETGDTTHVMGIEIVSKEIIDGEAWYIGHDGEKYRNAADGLHKISNGNTYFFKHPAKLHEQFAYYNGNPVFFAMTVSSVDSWISTKAGVFDCYKYTMKDHGTTVDVYYSPGTGLIRWDSQSASYSTTMELTQYRIN
jgi:hypothetical protein